MKCIILVGGYATRMYPLTLNKSKALLKINEKYILDFIFDNIVESSSIDDFILVTNDTFYEDYINWKTERNCHQNIKVVSDGSTSDKDKVGTVSALIKVIKELKIDDDLFILAGDNLLDFSLKYIFDDFYAKNNSIIMYYNELDPVRLSRTGVIEIDNNNFVLSMQEKPKNPKTNYAVPPFYWLKKKDVKILLKLFDENKKIDSMGQIILNLCQFTKIEAKKMIGKRYDVGSKEEYNNILNMLKVRE